jgi:hypothetical protein
MKKLSHITLVLLISLFTGSVAFASFPYTKETQDNRTETKTTILEETVNNTDTAKTNSRDLFDTLLTLVLAIFLGWLAAHRWYKHKPPFWNILFMICVWSGLGAVFLFNLPLLGTIGFIWWLIDLILILTGEF